jgi:uncharacterized membrane protein
VIHDILLPFAMGVLLIGAMMERTITVFKGDIGRTAALSVLISFVYWFNIQFVASGNIVAYVSFSVGTLLVTCWQAWREKRRHARQSSTPADQDTNT